MKKCILGLLLIVAIVAVSCTNDIVQDDTILVYFGTLKAKAIDTTAYDVGGTFSTSNNVEIGDVDDYYWQYKATKADDLFTAGQQTNWTVCTDNAAGLGEAKEFAKGAWTFELRAFSSVKDRTSAGINETSNAVFTGKITTENLTSNTSINVPMEYNYGTSGTGTVTFNLTTELSQDSLSSASTYEITKTEVFINGRTEELTKGTTSNNKTTWTGKADDVPTGSKSATFKFYLDNGNTASITNTSFVVVLPGLTTTVTESAAIALTGGKIQVALASTLPESQPTIQVGDTLYMGDAKSSLTFTSSNDFQTFNSLPWKVLEVKDNKALVISDRVIEKKNFDDTNSTNSWSDCSLRKYLNTSLLKDFNINVSIVEPEEGEAGYNAGPIFLLSEEEALSLLTQKSRAVLDIYNCTTLWSLRDDYETQPRVVGVDGSIGNSYESAWGVRPAFWIEI